MSSKGVWIMGMGHGVWIASGPGVWIGTLHFELQPYIIIYIYIYIDIYIYMYVYIVYVYKCIVNVCQIKMECQVKCKICSRRCLLPSCCKRSEIAPRHHDA